MPKESWAKKQPARPGGSGSRWLWRGIWTIGLVALFGWFGWLLFRPFLHPRTHLVLLTGDVISVVDSPSAIPADYVFEDFRELLKLQTVLHQGWLEESAQPLVLGSLRSADEMRQFADLLNIRVTGRGDVMLIYVSAHGLMQDGEAWLLASGTDPSAPLGGRYRLTSLLAQLRECTAATKVLLLDAGRIDYDPLRGLLDNDFPCRLERQVHDLGDPSLWVLVSHGAGQRSHISSALKRSVFGYFVSTGLAGGADASGDRTVDLRELSQFVENGVSNWVRQTTGGAVEQTPVLLWSGGNVPEGSLPALAAVRRKSGQQKAPTTPATIDHSQAVADAQSQPATSELQDRGQRELDSLISRSVVRATPPGQLSQYANETLQKLIAQAREAVQPSESEEKPKAKPPEAPAKEPAAGNKGGEAKSPEAKSPNGSAADKKGQETKTGAVSPESADKSKTKTPPPAAEGAEKNGKAKVEKAPADEAGDTPAELPPLPPVTAEELSAIAAQLNQAWTLRDQLAAADRPTARPLDYAPQLWGQLEARLLVLDRRFRTGHLQKAADLSTPLAEIVKTLEAVAADKSPAEAGALASRILAARPALSFGKLQPRSLAMLELLAREGGEPLSAELTPLRDQLDKVIATGNRTDLEAFAKTLKPEHDRWSELRIARWLAERSELDFRLVQLLLAATRASGRAAASGNTGTEWIRASVEEADANRLAAERQMLTAAARTDRDVLIASLTTVLETYETAIADAAAIRSAERLTADVWHSLPHYLAWNAAGRLGTNKPPAKLLDELLDQLAAIDALLATPAGGKAGAIRAATALLAKTRREVEHDLDPLNVEQLLAEPASPGEAWRIELLLQTPLPAAPVRAALVAYLPQIDAALAAQVEPAPPPPSRAAMDQRLRQDDERFFARAALQQRVWSIALLGLVDPDRDALSAALSKTKAAKGAAGADDSLEQLRSDAETALADLVFDLPARIERGIAIDDDLSSSANRPARLARLRGWTRAARLADPRSPAVADGSASTSPLADAAAYDLLAWLRTRARRAAEDAPPQESIYQHQIAAAYRTAAAAILRQPPLDFGATLPVEITGPDRVALTYESQQPLDLAIHNTTAIPQKVWLAAQWESELVALVGGAAQTIYPWAELSVAPAEQAKKLARVRPSLELAPGQTLRFPLTLQRRQASLYPTHLVLRALTEKHIARHDLAIALPPPEDVQLLIAGSPGRWTPGVAGLTLHPFPNRQNAFALKLATGKPVERKVDVELRPLLVVPRHELPPGPLSAADSKLLLGELTLGEVVGEAKMVTLPASGAPVALTLTAPKVDAPPPPPAPATGKAAPSAGPPPPPKPPPVPLAHGLMLVVTDQADQRQTFKWLQIAPQRPQRYIRPQVRYRAGRERIEIKVTAVDPELLPADGVKLQGDILEPLPPDAERQLDAVLKPGDAEAEMYVEVPAAAGRVVTLRLTVDGYPRAIYYRVPTSGETSDIAEDLDTLAARVIELPKGAVYKPPVAVVPVRIELDAPASVLKNPPLRVEAGIDRNRDRELRGDETLVLTTDRQVSAALVEVNKAGELVIDAGVADFTLNLPAASLVSGRANVLVRAILGDREAWSDPIEIVIDGEKPRSSAIELRPAGVVIAGQELNVSALCDDAGLSGVAKMEAAFDLERSGKFGGLAVPLPGALRDDGRWTAKLPTAGMASGSYNILVRAIDRAENVGEAIRTSVRVLTQAEADTKKKLDLSADITGVVAYGDTPQANTAVALRLDTGAPPPAKGKGKSKTEQPPPLATATTDAQGRFKFSKIAPGKYLLSAEALVKNKNRRAEQPLAFQLPAEVQPVTLKLK